MTKRRPDAQEVMERGDRLVDALINGDHVHRGAYSELLGLAFQGYPLERVARLLQSDNDGAVSCGAFVASELGVRGVPLLEYAKPLLTYRSSHVRGELVDVVNLSAGTDPEATAMAIGLMKDESRGARGRVLQLLTRAGDQELEEATSLIDDSDVRELTRWLREEGSDPDAADRIVERLGSDDEVTALFAAAATVRIADETTGPLEVATTTGSSELRSFASGQLSGTLWETLGGLSRRRGVS